MKKQEIKVEVIYTDGWKERFAEALVKAAERHTEVKHEQK